MKTMVCYDEAYYQKVMAQYGYVPCSEMKGLIPGFSRDEMDRWLCSYHLGPDQRANMTADNTFFTLGVGTNNVPHLGTLSQLLRALYILKLGYCVQVVIGDDDSCCTRNVDYEVVKKISDQWKHFLIDLGFNIETNAIIRTQSECAYARDIANQIAPYTCEQDFYDVEELIYDYYKDCGFYPGVTVGMQQGVLLTFADFLEAGIRKHAFVNYDNIVVLCGIDEHPYVPKAYEIMQRMGYSFNVAGLFTPIIAGLGDAPKMSKSLLGSGITLDMSRRDVINLVKCLPDKREGHWDSPVYKMIENSFVYDSSKMLALARHCDSDDVAWEKDKIDFAQDVYHYCYLWQSIEKRWGRP